MSEIPNIKARFLIRWFFICRYKKPINAIDSIIVNNSYKSVIDGSKYRMMLMKKISNK